jgi:hypothetical protein
MLCSDHRRYAVQPAHSGWQAASTPCGIRLTGWGWAIHAMPTSVCLGIAAVPSLLLSSSRRQSPVGHRIASIASNSNVCRPHGCNQDGPDFAGVGAGARVNASPASTRPTKHTQPAMSHQKSLGARPPRLLPSPPPDCCASGARSTSQAGQ